VRIVVAKCSVDYTGRGDTQLPPSTRAIIIKADGAVSIHADTNGNKPLNYMGAGNKMTESHRGRQKIWTFEKKSETIKIKLHKIVHDFTVDMSPVEPGLARKGTERDLQAFLADHPEDLGFSSPKNVHREFNTGAGAVDLLIQVTDSFWYLVEVKRTANLDSVSQTQRYWSSLQRLYPEITIHAGLAAFDFKPSALEQAHHAGIQTHYVSLPTDNS
jgi:RecB family endonuclease NucS